MLERLQKIIARAGIASRRHAEELIRSGQVRVNGAVVTELGAKADPERDRVEAAGRVAERPSEPSYLLLNKPIHVVSTMSDPEGRATLRHVLRGLGGGIFPVGRLDYAASGLMLLTSDGELADRIFKNSARLPQVYWLKVAGRLTDDEMQQVRRKAHARMRRLRAPDAVSSQPANPWYEVELNDARRDLLRRALFSRASGGENEAREAGAAGVGRFGGRPLSASRTARSCATAQIRRPAEEFHACDAQKARDSPRTRSQQKAEAFCQMTASGPVVHPSDQQIKDLLQNAHTIAVVGLSSSRLRASYGVSQYMQSAGYRIIPVNPNEQEVLGEKSYSRLEDVPEKIDVVDVFRRSEFVPEIVDAAIRVGARAIWLQDGVVDEVAAQRARDAGLFVVMDDCILREHRRLMR